MTKEEQRKRLEAEVATCLKIIALSDELPPNDRREHGWVAEKLGEFWTEEFTHRGRQLRDLPRPEDQQDDDPLQIAGRIAEIAHLTLHFGPDKLRPEADALEAAAARFAAAVGRWLLSLDLATPVPEAGGELRVVEGGGNG